MSQFEHPLEVEVAGIRGPVKQRYLFIDAAVLGSRELVQLVLDVQETPAHVQVGAVLRVDAVEEPQRTRKGAFARSSACR